MVLGKLPVLRHPANLDYSWARTSAPAVGAGGGCLDIFSLIYHFSSFSVSLGDDPTRETTRHRLKYCLKGPLNRNNQPKST